MVGDNHDTKFRYMVSLYDPRQMPVRPIIPIQLVLIHHSFMGVRSLWTLHRAGCYKGILGCTSEQALRVHVENDHGSGVGVIGSSATGRRQLKFPAVNGRSRDSKASQSPLPAKVVETLTSTANHDSEAASHHQVGKQKKVGFDWSIDFNQMVPRTLDIDLVHTIALEGVITCVDFSPDGVILAVGGTHGVKLFNTLSGTELATLRHSAGEPVEGPGKYVRTVCFCSGGAYLLTGVKI